ncbi:lipase member K-like isoform X1 [Nylanderia fulva]|uniref:lipase member K-like isoform X1 n=1 Tax=Nylanderia fulva TaxID=613905 RepID=UPI0010FAE89F|nr:lipase member K-like isoform X1 [Nylanderia fulva]
MLILIHLTHFARFGHIRNPNGLQNATTEPNKSIERIIRSKRNDESNSDLILSTPEIIKKTGYPTETHVVTTEDGYILTLHRIPGGNSSLPVLLVHGTFCDDTIWIALGKGKALAYLLADQRYDVWLANVRGTPYSKKHVSLSPSDWKYWDFSFHEEGIYDLPAMITYITDMRSQPLHAYIGHSKGTSAFYIMAIHRPKIARMIKMMINTGPAVFVDHMKSPLRPILYLIKEFQSILRVLFHDELFPEYVNNILKTLLGCNLSFYQAELCANNFLFIPFGYNPEQLNLTNLPFIVSHMPVTTSLKTVVHIAQIIQSGTAREYDYGATKNLLIYKSVEPPEYDLSKVAVPIALYYGKNDLFVDPIDVKRLYNALPNVIDIYELPNFNHMDFIFAKDAPKLLYERVLKFMKGKYSNNVTTI